MNPKLFFLITVFLIGHSVLSAQSTKVSFSGIVTDAKTGESMPQVVINIKELNLWTVSDQNGQFHFKEVPPGEYTIQSSCLGYTDYELKIKLLKNIEQYNLKMKEESLALKEVVVTATDPRKMSSTSHISKTALEHLQVTSLQDAMQLLPGSLTANPSLNKSSQIRIRSILSDDNTALGTSIIIDGAKISNDANMQINSTTTANLPLNSTSGLGVDSRQIPVDNIESIEVIRGVASAEYGDLTSGAVIVKTRAGRSPFEARVKVTPNIKQVSLGKGVGLGKNKGFLNIDADYAKSFEDIRTPAQSYDRANIQLGYSNIFNANRRAFSFNFKLYGGMTIDKVKKDPDQSKDDLTTAKDNKIRVNIFGNWMVNKPWLTSLKYTLAGSYGKQYNRTKRWTLTSMTPYTLSTETGENIGDFTDYEYYNDVEIEGKPLYTQAKLTANISGKYNIIYNNFLLGAEWTATGNQGNGKTYTPQYTRPLSERHPAIHAYSGFMEDKITLPIKKASLEISAGIRITKISTDASAKFDAIADPRFNGRLTLVDRAGKKGLQNISLRGGWGILHKMPTLVHLYPDPVYKDIASFTYKDEDPYNRLSVMTTFASETDNPDLKLPESKNMEVGIDLKAFGMSANVTYFKEKLSNGYNFELIATPTSYRRYNAVSTQGVRPEYTNGEVNVNGTPVGYENIEDFITYKRPGNGMSVDKWGIEYSLHFGRIEAIRTSIQVDGAYFHQKQMDNSLQPSQPGLSINGKPFPYVGIYAGNATASNGSLRQRLNTNIQLITHIPQIRLVFTITGQCVWMDKSKNIASYGGKDLYYMMDTQGNIIPGDPSNDEEYIKCVNPIFYMGTDGVIHEFTEEQALDPVLKNMVVKSSSTFFLENSYNPYFMLNLKLTKEIGNIASLSFYANNFTNSRPHRYQKTSKMSPLMNTGISFGAELSLKF